MDVYVLLFVFCPVIALAFDFALAVLWHSSRQSVRNDFSLSHNRTRYQKKENEMAVRPSNQYFWSASPRLSHVASVSCRNNGTKKNKTNCHKHIIDRRIAQLLRFKVSPEVVWKSHDFDWHRNTAHLTYINQFSLSLWLSSCLPF